MNDKKPELSERDKKHIELFGHPLPSAGGSYRWDPVTQTMTEIAPQAASADELKKAGFIEQPTTVTKETLAADAAQGVAVAAAAAAARPAGK